MFRIETSQGIVDLGKIACILYLDEGDNRVSSSDSWKKVMVVLQNSGGFFLILQREEAEKFVEIYDSVSLDDALHDIKIIKEQRSREYSHNYPIGLPPFDFSNVVVEDVEDNSVDEAVASDIAYDSHRERSS